MKKDFFVERQGRIVRISPGRDAFHRVRKIRREFTDAVESVLTAASNINAFWQEFTSSHPSPAFARLLWLNKGGI
jgi:hypothetical protein